MTRKLIFAAAFLFLLAETQAQHNTLSFSFQMSLPAGNYKDTYPKTGTGLLLGYLHSFPSQPSVAIGGEIGLIVMNEKNDRYNGTYLNEYNTYYVSASSYIFTIA